MESVLNKILAKLNEILKALKKAFKPSSVEVATTPLPDMRSVAVEPVRKPETPRNPMDPRSVLGIPVNGPDGSANPTELFRGDPKHPKYRPGDGRKIMMVRDALIDGKKWDFYLTSAGEVWDLEVPPDHPSIGFKIPRD